MVVERPNISNGGKLIILGVELQTWVFIVVNIVAIVGVYFSLRYDVDTLLSHEKTLPTWAVQLTAKLENIQEKQKDMLNQVNIFNSGGSAALSVLREQVNSLSSQCRDSNARQDHLLEQLDGSIRDNETVMRYIIQYFGAHPNLKDLKKRMDQKE